MDPESPYIREINLGTAEPERSRDCGCRERRRGGASQRGYTSMQKYTDPQIVEIRSADKKQVQRAQSESNFESLLDVAEAAKLLRIHPKTLRNKARQGIIPGVHVGRLWRFRPSALNEWLDGIAS
jgi:excisionase family DNA binding protein